MSTRGQVGLEQVAEMVYALDVEDPPTRYCPAITTSGNDED